MSSKNIIFYLWNKEDTSDKIYGALEAGGHVYAFYGRRNPSEEPKEKASMTVISVGSDCNDLDEEMACALDLLESKIKKGYVPMFISDHLAEYYSGFRLRYITRNGNCKIGGNYSCQNYHNFDETIKKKLAKKMMLRK